MALHVSLLTPQGVVFDGKANALTVPSFLGETGILPGHVPCVLGLKAGILTLAAEGGSRSFFVRGGVLNVTGDDVCVQADLANAPEDIDLKRAVAAEERAEAALRQRGSGKENFSEHLAALERARFRQQLVKK